MIPEPIITIKEVIYDVFVMYKEFLPKLKNSCVLGKTIADNIRQTEDDNRITRHSAGVLEYHVLTIQCLGTGHYKLEITNGSQHDEAKDWDFYCNREWLKQEMCDEIEINIDKKWQE